MRPHLWVLVAALSAGTSTAHAQTPLVLSGPATCQQCRIELEQVVVLGDSTGPGMLHEQSGFTIDQRGRFYVTSNYVPTIAVFDAGGRFLRRIGREGRGPGEFTVRPFVLFGPGDTLYALDRNTRRMMVFSPEYELVRTSPLGLVLNTAVRLPDGRFLVSGGAMTAATIGYPLHLLDHKGTLVRSFGSATGAHDLFAGSAASVRRLAAPVGETVWTVKTDELVLEQWHIEGRKLAHITRQAPWFPRKVALPRGATDGTHRQPPLIRSLSQDKAGLLWSLTAVPDREWRPHTLPPAPGGNGSTYTPDSLRHNLLDSVLEVIDPARGVVLFTQTFDANLLASNVPDLLVSFTEDAGGNPRYVVWRARLVVLSSR